MIASNERRLSDAHARALRARGNSLPPEGMPPPAILDSWARCLEFGLDIAAPPKVQVADATDLANRRERSEFVRRLARAELETLSQQIAGSNFLLAFADQEGVILDLYADNRFLMATSDANIVIGSRWGEDLCGTNGLGTAQATGQAVAVTGREHFFLKLGDVSCSAAPVRDATGAIVGLLDASSYFESRQRHTLALVQMASAQIENALLVHQMRAQTVLAIHPRAEYLSTLSAGLLAFDEQGRLQALNARAMQLLVGLDAIRGASFEALFGELFAHVLARLHVSHEAPLRDMLGSSLVATVVSRPPLRRLHAPPTPRSRGTAALPAPSMHAAAAPDFVAADPDVAQACRLVAAAVRMNVPILIQGETGTGKELLARYAHQASARTGAFVAVNCGALPDALFEAELFGYVGGAFTGSRREGSIGLIASADGGTLLLDELHALPRQLQAALLRFLDDRLVRPVGGTSARKVDVLLLAATNVDLDTPDSTRPVREDLLYRLNTVKVSLPPLRRRQDFADAVRRVLHTVDAQATIDAEAIELLARHRWPGNFRELRAVLTRALLAGPRSGDAAAIEAGHIESFVGDAGGTSGSALQRSVADLVRREFERCERSVSQTSRALGVSRTTVYRHLGAAPRSADDKRRA